MLNQLRLLRPGRKRKPLQRSGWRRKQEDRAGEDERGAVRERAARVRAVVLGVVETGGVVRRLGVVGVVVVVLVVVVVVVVVIVVAVGVVVVVVIVVVVIQVDDRPVDVDVIVPVVQRVQPRQDRQRAGERAEDKRGETPSVKHPRPTLGQIPKFGSLWCDNFATRASMRHRKMTADAR